MTGVKMKLDGGIRKKLGSVYEKHTFDVGIIEERPHRAPAPGRVRSFAGGPARKPGTKITGTVSQVSRGLQGRLGVDLYRGPFRHGKSRDVRKFVEAFFALAFHPAERKRAELALQAVVRNPILRGDYGRNTPAGARAKGFNRLLVDTGQLFSAIRAKVTVRRGK